MINEIVLMKNYSILAPEYNSDTASSVVYPMIPFVEEYSTNSTTEVADENNRSIMLPKIERMFPVVLDEMYIRMQNEQDKKTTQLVSALEQQLYRALVTSNHERDSLSSAEQLVIDISEKYSFRILGEVVSNIYVKYNDYPGILVALCEALERFDSDEVSPWGYAMLVCLLVHKSDSVKEAASVLIENWATVSLLPILRNIDVNAKWLKEYINSVVQYLEGCEKDVLCQEVG